MEHEKHNKNWKPRIRVSCIQCGKEFETYFRKNGSRKMHCSQICSNKTNFAGASKLFWDKRRADGDMRSPRDVNRITADEYRAMKSREKPLCQCGCGKQVSRASKQYIFGHFANTLRKKFKKECRMCGRKFITHIEAHVICRRCSSSGKRTNNLPPPTAPAERVKRICPVCGKEYERTKREEETNKKITCSFTCGIIQTGRAHIKGKNGWPITPFVQREMALSIRQSCDQCGYDEQTAILVIHHKDRIRSNGDPENIALLCPNCHALEHYRMGTGLFAPKLRRKSLLVRG